MTIMDSPFYGANASSDIRRGLQSIAGMFAPPAASDIAAYASARDSKADATLKEQRQGIIEKLRGDPRYAGADAGVLADLFDPDHSWAAQDQNDATARRAQDVTAATSVTNNENAVRGSTIGSLYGALSPGQTRPEVPANVASTVGLPEIIAVAGAPKPLSETEVKGALLQQQLPASPPALTNDQIVALSMGTTPVENIVTPAGPRMVYRPDAVGQQPAYAPNKEIMSDGYGNPGDGLVWARDAEGNVKLDDRGAPIALPYQGGKVWQQEQADKASGDVRQQNTDTKGGIVVQDLDRALSQIEGNPMLTTGVGSQATSWLGGTPAQAVNSLLDTIRANTGFDQLQALRNASPTGGALGPVSDTENKLLQAVLGSVDPKQPATQLADNLKRLKNVYLDIIHGPGKGPPRERLSFPSQWDQFAAPLVSAPVAVERPLPPGVTEDDVQFTAKKYGLTRDQVLQRLGAVH